MASDNRAEIVVDGDISPLRRKLQEVAGDLKRFGDSGKRSIEGITGPVNNLTSKVLGLGAVLSVGGFAAFAKSAIDAEDALDKLSIRTGVSVETLAGLKLAADQADTSMEVVGVSVGKLQRAIGEAQAGNEQFREVLKALGITAKDPEQALIQLADAVARLNDPNQRAYYLNKLLGESYQQLLPLLSGGGAALRELIERGRELNPVTAESARNAAEFNDNLTELQTAIRGVGVRLANPLVSSLKDVAYWMEVGYKRGGGFTAILAGIGTALAGMVGIEIDPLKRAQAGASAAFKELAAARAELERVQALAANRQDLGPLGRWLWGSRVESAEGRVQKAKEALRAYNDEVARLSKQAAALSKQAAAGSGGAGGDLPPIPALSPKPKSKSGAGSRISDAQWAMEEEAHLTRTLTQLADERGEAEEAAFQRATTAAEEFEAIQEQIRDGLMASRDEIISLIDPVEAYRKKLEQVRDLYARGLLTADQATAAEFAIQEQIDQPNGPGDKVKETAGAFEEFSKQAARNMQGAFADFLFDPFSQGLDGMLLGFVNTLRRMLSEALAAKIMESIFGVKSGGGFGGGFGDVFSSIFSGFFDAGGRIPSGQFGIAGEYGPEIITGPATVMGRQDTANTLQSALAGANQGGGVRIVNVVDPSMAADYMQSAAGERVILNALRSNAGAVRQILA